MSERPERGSPRKRRSKKQNGKGNGSGNGSDKGPTKGDAADRNAPLPQPDEAGTRSGSPDETGTGRPEPTAPVQLKSSKSLERLKTRVIQATGELERLRKENAALAQRISELEAGPLLDREGVALSFEEEPEVLRRKIESFIEAIDTYLAQDNDAE